jgi:cellulose synthase/poly-beta-1,6-N-acetylglucosamine synthase-like glycosyltransferase
VSLTTLGFAQAMALVLSVTFLCYVVAILLPYVRARPRQKGHAEDLAWHLFVPARDEAAVIGGTVATLRERFPTAHVWVIDDASTDATPDLVADASERDPLVHLVRRHLPHARTGKGDALNAAYRALGDHLAASGGTELDRSKVIVGVVDADGEPAPDCLDVIAAPHLFGDADVAAVQICVRMINRDERRPSPSRGRLVNLAQRTLVRMQDLEFCGPIAAVQITRQRTRTVGLGGNGQFTRLAALDAIAVDGDRPWHGSLLEDYELSLHLLIAGYRSEYTMDTHVEQEGLTSLRRFVTQRTRWGQGTMQCGSYLPRLWNSPHVTSAGVFEASYYLLQPWLQLLGTFVYSIPLGLFLATLATDPGRITAFLTHGGWTLSLLYLAFGFGPFVVWGPLYVRRWAPEVGRVRALGFGFAYAAYVLLFYVTSWRAFGRIVSGRSGWAKTRRNREAVVGPVALEA